MKKVVVLLQLLVAVFGFSGFYDIYSVNLSNSSSYISSNLSLKNAELSLKKAEQIFTPYLSAALNQGGGLVLNQDGLEDFTLSLKADFLDIAGFKAGITLPVTFSVDDGEISSDLSFDISKGDLFSEDKVELLETKADYYDSVQNLKDIEAGIFISTVQDILDCYAQSQQRELYLRELAVIQNKYDGEKDEDTRRNLKRELLTKQKQIINIENTISGYDGLEVDEGLYLETLSMVEKLLETDYQSVDYKSRYDMVAQELRVEAEKIKAGHWYYPYLPELGVNFSIDDLEDFSWSLAFSFNFQVLDNGERELEAEARKTGVQEMKYDESLANFEDSIDKHSKDMDTTELDLELAELDLEDKRADLEKEKKLYDLGFSSQEDLALAEIDVSKAELDLIGLKHGKYITDLNFLNSLGFFPAPETLNNQGPKVGD